MEKQTTRCKDAAQPEMESGGIAKREFWRRDGCYLSIILPRVRKRKKTKELRRFGESRFVQRVCKRLKRKEVTKLRETRVVRFGIASARTHGAVPWAVCRRIRGKELRWRQFA